MKVLHIITWVLIIIGALNWGLVGLFDWNLVDTVFGVGSSLATIIYVLVGLSALVEIFTHGKHCRMCKPGAGMSQSM